MKHSPRLDMTAVDVMPRPRPFLRSFPLQLAALTINEKQFMPQKARRTWPDQRSGGTQGEAETEVACGWKEEQEGEGACRQG